MSRWLDIILSVLGGLVFLGALGWFLIRTLKRTEDPARLIFKWVLSLAVLGGIGALAAATLDSYGGVVVPFACVAAGVVLTVLWAPNIGTMLAKPISSLYDGGDEEAVPEPLYSIAEAKRKRGRFQEALFDVREQLKRFPADYKGQILQASILAENVDDLAGAKVAIERLCQQPGHPPYNVAMALNQLADWQLKYGQDPEEARITLEKILLLFPDTEMTVLAGQRIAHLAGAADLAAAKSEAAPIRMRVGVQNVGLLKDSSSLRPPPEDQAAAAAGLVAQLEKYPQDSEAREKLAMIYAEHYQRLDLAADQLQQLIEQPHQPAKQVVRWANLLADLQIKHGHDAAAATETLNRLMEKFPGTASATQAEQRLARLKIEAKGQEAPPSTVKLGTYEQKLGLKQGWAKPQ